MNSDSSELAIPDGFELARITDVFDNGTVPAGLLRRPDRFSRTDPVEFNRRRPIRGSARGPCGG